MQTPTYHQSEMWTEEVYIQCEGFSIKVKIPRGHTIEELDLAYSIGDGWVPIEEG